MINYKTMVIASLIAIMALGCGSSKDSSSSQQNPNSAVSPAHNQTPGSDQIQDQPSDEIAGGSIPSGNKASDSRVAAGLAWLVGGSFVFAVAYPIERFSTELFAVYKSLPSKGLRLLDFLAARQKLISATMPGIQWMRPRFAGKVQSYARRLLIGDLTMADLAAKARRTRMAMWGGRTLYAVGAAMTVIGIVDLVLTPTELADGEITSQDRFEDLKRSAWSLAEKPQDVELQDHLIRNTIAFLPDVIHSLKQEYNTRLTEITVLDEQEGISAEKKRVAQEEFKKFEEGQLKTIAFFERSLKALQEVHESDINSLDEAGRQKAMEILKKSIEELNKIYVKE